MTTMTTLHQLTEDMIALDALLEEHQGDISDPAAEAAVSEWLAELERNLARKSEGYASLIGELEARAEARKRESKRLSLRASIDERKADWLRARLLDAMRRTDTPLVETERYRISIARNGGVAPVVVTGDVPVEYRRIVSEPDMTAIRRALAEGVELAFASLGQRGERLVIR